MPRWGWGTLAVHEASAGHDELGRERRLDGPVQRRNRVGLVHGSAVGASASSGAFLLAELQLPEQLPVRLVEHAHLS